MSNDELLYKQKYLKYKAKYIELKNQEGGTLDNGPFLLFYNREISTDSIIEANRNFISTINDNNKIPKNNEKNKNNQIKIQRYKINGLPVWKYNIETGIFESLLHLKYDFSGSTEKKEGEKTYNTQLRTAEENFKKETKIDFSKIEYKTGVSWKTYISSASWDNIHLIIDKFYSVINNILFKTDKTKNLLKYYNTFYTLSKVAIGEGLPSARRGNLKPIIINDKIGIKVDNEQVTDFNSPLNEFIIVNSIKHEPSTGELTFNMVKAEFHNSFVNPPVNTFVNPPVNTFVNPPVNTFVNPPVNTFVNPTNTSEIASDTLPDALTATPTN
jgi:hypothetical protein